MNPAIHRIKNRKMLRAQNALGLSALLVASAATVGSLHAQTNWNSAAVTTADRYTVGTSTSLLWSDTTAWFGGTVANGAGLSVSLEPRHLTGAMTVTVDGTYTVGTLTSRTSNADLRFTGAGKLIFDNTGGVGGTTAGSYWNATSRTTRLTNLRTDLFVNFQMNNALDIRMGVSRAEETNAGRIGNIISGDGKLTLSLAQNDPATNRLIKIGNGASANTYTGGTEIRHVVNTTYGTGHGVGVNSLLINAVNTGAFGTGDVTLNSQGLNTSAVTTLTGGSGGLQLVLSADNSMGSTAVLTQSGNGAGTVYLGSTSQTIGGLVSTTTNKRIQTGNGILSIVTAADRSYSGAIVGSGAINIGGTHTQTFDGANTFTGVTTFKGGSLGVATIGDGGVASGNLGSATADAANLVFDGGALKYTGASSSTNRSFTINNLKTAIINVSESATELTMSGNSGASTGGLTKQGLGTLILTGTHAYTGNTLVSGGILKLGATGSLSSASKITVSSGATFDVSATAGYTVGDNETLDGSGTIVGNVTIGDGGFHAPGNSPGVQEIDGNLAYLENSRLLWDLTVPTDPSDNFSSEIQTGRGTSWDGIDVTGDLTGAGGIFRIILSGSNDFTGAFWLEGRRWEGVFSAPNSDLFDLNTIFTSFEFYNAGGSIAGPLEGEFSFDGSDLVFAIPEPSSALFGLLIGAGLLRRRRAA